MTEREWEQIVRDYAGRHGYWVFHPYDSRRSTPGWPDLAMVHPSWGRFLLVELKTQGGRLTNAQKRWGAALVAAGVDWRVWRPGDWDEVQRTLTEKE